MSKRSALNLALVCAAPLVAVLEAFGQTALTASADTQYRPVILAVTLNGLPGDQGMVLLQDSEGHLLVPAAFMRDFNLRVGSLRAIAAAGEMHYDLGKIQGMSYSWDHAREELTINAEADAFLPTRLNIGASQGQRAARYTPGGYLNYDLSLTHGGGNSSNQALIDVGLFRGEGLLTSSFNVGSESRTRLMSTYQTDRIDALKTLRVGDSYNSTGAWGRGVLYGGIQYGTNFAIRPDFITAAMPSVSGKALLPSTVDVYVNNALRTRQSVNAGPFTIQNLPVITGAGEVLVMVKDLLGREQLISQPFFASPSLLREGLVEDAYEFGWQRQNYGLKSNDYRDPFATATYRKGLSNSLTGEARAELQKDTATAGASFATLFPTISSVLESSLVFSRSAGLPTGSMASLNYSYLGRRWSASARMQVNSLSFRQVGSDPANLPRQTSAAQFSAPLGPGTVSASYLRRLNQGESATRIITASYAQRISNNVFANVTLLKPLSTGSATSINLVLTVVFDQKHFASASVNGQPGAASMYTEFQKAAPKSEGTGYRLAALNGQGNARQEASVTHNARYASLQAELVRTNGAASTRLSAQGGIDYLAGGMYFSRGLGEGFAVVQTKGIPGVAVLLENQVVAYTDKEGRAVVGNLLAYQKNSISIDPLTLPMDVAINEVEKTVMPRLQGGVLIDFKIRRTRGVTLTIRLASGELLPPQTAVEVVGVAEEFVSGLRGEVFVELPQAKGNRVIARPAGSPMCELLVDQPDTNSTTPFLEPMTCATNP
ncbi:MAG: fimbria/pilus outer membrane usher protein [Polaromonas sp.]